MRLSGYLLQAVLLRFGLLLAAFATLIVAFHLGGAGRQLAGSLAWSAMLQLGLLELPLALVQLLPIALLLALVLALSALRQRGEIEAMVSLGVAPLRLCAPLLAAGLLAAALAVLLDELVVPPCEQRKERWLDPRRASSLTGLQQPVSWARQRQWFLHLSPQPGRTHHVLALELDATFRPRQRLEGSLEAGAPQGRVQAVTRWQLDGRAFSREHVAELRLPQLGHVAWLAAEPRRAEALSTLALRRHLAVLEQAGQVRDAERLVLYTKLAYPFVNLVVAGFGCAFALNLRRRSALVDLAMAVGLALGIWTLLAGGWLLGRSGWLTPAGGVGLPLALASAASVAAVLRRWHGSSTC